MNNKTIIRICWKCHGKGTNVRRKALGPETCWPCNGKGHSVQTVVDYIEQEKRCGRLPQE